jgi:hypothetical protein
MSERLGTAPIPQDALARPDGPLPYAAAGIPETSPISLGGEPLAVAGAGEYSYGEALWGGGLAMGPTVELSYPSAAAGKTDMEKAAPPVMGDVMQFARVMQEAMLLAILGVGDDPRRHNARWN